jgi:hypothetical protein
MLDTAVRRRVMHAGPGSVLGRAARIRTAAIASAERIRRDREEKSGGEEGSDGDAASVSDTDDDASEVADELGAPCDGDDAVGGVNNAEEEEVGGGGADEDDAGNDGRGDDVGEADDGAHESDSNGSDTSA